MTSTLRVLRERCSLSRTRWLASQVEPQMNNDELRPLKWYDFAGAPGWHMWSARTPVANYTVVQWEHRFRWGYSYYWKANRLKSRRWKRASRSVGSTGRIWCVRSSSRIRWTAPQSLRHRPLRVCRKPSRRLFPQDAAEGWWRNADGLLDSPH